MFRRTVILSVALSLLLSLSILYADTPEIHKVIRIFEDGTGITRTLSREAWDIADYRGGERIDLVVNDAELGELAGRGVRYTILREDLGASLRACFVPLDREFGAYHTYTEIDSAFSAMEAANPTLVEKIDFGDSWQGRDLLALKITDNVSVSEGEPQAMFIGCHHAREIISVEMPFLFAEYLLDNYGTDSLVTALVDCREIWVVPMLNPDGHQYVVDVGDWRKNRRNNGDGTYGVDLNRNWPYLWGLDDVGSSPYTSSGTYRGPSAGSEPELQGLLTLFQNNSFTTALSFHSYGRMYLYPWGYDRIITEDNDMFVAIGDNLAVANNYTPGSAYTGLIYLTNGAFDDWTYGDTSKVQCISLTPEIGDEFDTPPDSIASHFNQQLPGMLFMVQHADNPYRFNIPGTPVIAPMPDDEDGDYTVSWTKGDGDSGVVAWELVEGTGGAIILDSAENGIDDWATDTWTWDSEKHHSGTHSYYSGTGDKYNAILEAPYPLDVEAGDSLTFWAWWRLEADWDYWYVEVSDNNGKSWETIPGSFTTDYDPNGGNRGNGITNHSSSVFQPMAFDLGDWAGTNIRVRFHYITGDLYNLRGVQIDDVYPLQVFTGTDTLSSTIPEQSFDITDRNQETVYHYWVRGIDNESQWGYWSVPESIYVAINTNVADGTPRVFELGANRPNPFNPVTSISYEIGAPGRVGLTIHDISGRLVRTLVSGNRNAGRHEVIWDGTDNRGADVASGVYLYRMRSGDFADTKKLVLLR